MITVRALPFFLCHYFLWNNNSSDIKLDNRKIMVGAVYWAVTICQVLYLLYSSQHSTHHPHFSNENVDIAMWSQDLLPGLAGSGAQAPHD